MVDEGLRIFRSLKNSYRIQPGVQHYGCLVDLLGRAGMLEEAKKVVTQELGKEMVRHLIGQRLDHSGVHACSCFKHVCL